MDSKAIDNAMRNHMPVVCNGKHYDRIAEYISWYKDGERQLSVGLLQGRTLYRVPAERVELEGKI